MKPAFLWFCVIAQVACLGVERLDKAAVLILPEHIECKIGSGHYLAGEIGFRWDGSEALKIHVWKDPDAEKNPKEPRHVMGALRVFDETGKELDRLFFVSIPPIPDGEAVIKSGEYRQFGFFSWNGSVVFPRPGNYYAVATFGDAWTGEKNVVFTTSKRWFKVVEAPPKLNSL